ncbi:hypothetical protein [Streptomyces sp. NBC_01768]|uniref:hypothetical protein n=1 Tax=Streptomyces sp. NBC_01768 TaxID=2975938 RepID=UPI002DDB614A|nr:hypothetical protein [Streptomyces sp. NBC_01768]WSC31787.1 hypothetical protein OG902_36640 [Streptomyces sp. NBC_01768]
MNQYAPDLNVPDLPDVERLALKALRRWLTGVTVRVDTPPDPLATLPLVVAHRVAGAAGADPTLIDRATLTVECHSDDRATASELARAVRAVLPYAGRHGFGDDTGYLATTTVLVEPWPTTDGPDHFVFTLTVRCLARPRRG